jgi:hypothetical protein
MTIFNPSSCFKEDPLNDSLEETYYTLIGSEDKLDSENLPIRSKLDSKVYAKKIMRADQTVKYLIRLDRNGKLFNPISFYGEEKNNNFLDRVCRSNDKFKQVSQKTFNLYAEFLKSKNPAWLNNAERETE